MRRLGLLLCFCFYSLLFSQHLPPGLHQVRQIADQNARALWGSNLFGDEPSPYYGPDDQIIAWQFNYKLGNSFPSKSELMENCDTALQSGDRASAWGDKTYGNLVMGANREMPVFIEYSQCLSQQYTLGKSLERAAAERFPQGWELGKTYYLGIASVWFQISDGTKTDYLRLEPKPQWLGPEEFQKLISTKTFFWQKDEFSEEWSSFLDNAATINDRDIIMIPGESHMPFYAWNYGCVPISAAMIAAWWDSFHGLGRLIDSYYNRYDDIVDANRTHTPRIAYRLAYNMETGSTSGNTDPWDVNDGLEDGFADMGYTVDCEGSYGLWPTETFWSEIRDYIRNDTPGLATIDEDYWTFHTTAAVGYNQSPRSVFVHDPNRPSLRNVSRSMLEADWYVYPNLYPSYYLGLTSPRGDTSWGSNGTGETLYSGDMYEISWFANPRENTYVKLYYHVNGGFPEDEWILITDNTENDGVYDWKVPGVSSEQGSSTTNARIKIELYDSATNANPATDASYGNFNISAGGTTPNLIADGASIDVHPDYFKVNHSQTNAWGVISIKDAPTGGDDFWKLQLFSDPNFTTQTEESYLWDTLNYLLIDNHHRSPQEYGLKLSNLGSHTGARAQFHSNPGAVINPGTQANGSITGNDVARVWNVYLEPGDYCFEMDPVSDQADLDFALFKWGGDGIFTHDEAVASSANPGPGGSETFQFSPFEAGYYGLVVSTRTIVNTNYTIDVIGAGRWDGSESTDWYNPLNWSGGILPTQNHNVIIPSGLSNYPLVDAGWANAAFVKTLTIESGARLTIHHGYLNVYGDLQIFGQLRMTYFNGVLDVTGNIVWESGSSVQTLDSPTIYCYGNWHFKTGTNVHFTSGYVSFVSDQNSYIESDSSDSNFYNLKLEKTNASVIFSSLSERNLYIQNDLQIGPNSILRSESIREICLTGQLAGTDTGRGHYYLDRGSIRFLDDIAYLSATPGDYFNNIIINTQNFTYLVDNLSLRGNLTISSGGLDAGTCTITLGGSWTNQMGTAGFAEDTGTVIFNGMGIVNCHGEDFNLLVINNPLCELHFDDGISSANAYDWIAGTLYVGGGTLTIDDLVDNGLFGNYTVQRGTLNISQNIGQTINLSGELHIFGGVMNVSGGAGDSLWPGATHAWIEMNGGELNFSNQSIYIHTSPYLLTAEISGGVIRTPKNFVCDRIDFMPEGGVIELNGSQAAIVSCTAPSHIPGLMINKGAGNNVNLNGDMVVWTDLILESGSFNLNGHLLVVGDGMEVTGNLIMTNPADVLMIGQHLSWFEGSSANVTAGEIQVARWLYTLPGTNISLGTANTFKFNGNEESVILHEGSSFTFGNLILDKFNNPVSLNGSGSLLNVSGNLTINSGSSLIPQQQSLSVSGVITNNGIIDLPGPGSLNGHGAFVSDNAASLNLTGGSLILDKNYTGTMVGLTGNINISDGLLEVTNNGILIGTAANLQMSGGTLRLGWNFQATYANTFLPTGGAVEFIGNRLGAIDLTNGNKLFNLLINKPGLSYSVSSYNALQIDNDLTIQNGVFGIGAITVTVNRDVLINGGRLEMPNASALLKVGRNWSNAVGSAAFIESSGTVYFFSAQTATISAETFNKVNIEKTAVSNNIISYAGNLSVNTWLNIVFGSLRPAASGLILDCNGNLSLQDGASLYLDAQPNSSLYLAGNFNDYNYVTNTSTGYYAPNSTHLIFDGATDQTLNGSYSNSRMYLGQVTVNKSGGSVKHNCSMNFNGNVLISNGGWSYAVSGKSKAFNRDLSIEAGGSLNDTTAGISFTGTNNVQLKILGTLNCGAVTVNKGSTAAAISLSGNTAFTAAGNLQMNGGTLNLNGFSFSYPASISVGGLAKLSLSPGSTLILADNSTLNLGSGAQLSCLGSSANPALVTSAGYYNLLANPNANLAAQYTIFEKMGSNGLNLVSGSIVDPVYSFTGCTFRNGISGGSLLTLNCQQDLNIENAVFPDNTWGGAYNVSRIQSIGSITFTNSQGDFSGPAYEHDPSNNVNWIILAPPGVPQNLQITIVGDAVNLSWSAVADADGYKIYRSFDPTSFDLGAPLGSTELNHYSDESVPLNGKLFYLIKAYRN